MIKTFLALILAIFCLSSFAHDDEFGCFIKDEAGRYREHQVDFETMDLDLSFDMKNSKVIGTVNYVFHPLQNVVDTLFLDAPNISIDEVKLNGKNLEFRSNDDGLIIYFENSLTFGKEYTLDIAYLAYPEKGLYFLGWNDETNRLRKQIWTQGQGIDNRHWIPSFDGVTDKLITRTNITFETGYEVVSNGVLENKVDNNDGTTTWNYAMSKPHVMYLVMLAIGEYAYKDITSNNGVVSRQYYYPDLPETFEPTYQYSAEMMDWLEGELDVPYPWETYRNVPVQDFLYGAMENTTSTIFTDYYVQDRRAALERNYIGTNAHELTHQWFGDYITEWSSTHHWLHESFATHYAKHFRKSVFGEDAFQWQRRSEINSAWRAAKKDNMPVAHSKGGSARHYPKGSIVIDMLRYVVGEEGYKRVITNFLKNNPYGMVDTHEFEVEFMETLGVNLDWFFDQWLYRGGEPEYAVSYEAKNMETVFTVKQTQEINDMVKLFKMPIVFQVHYTDGSIDEVKTWIENEDHVVAVPNSKGADVAFGLFDPNWQVLKNVNFEKETAVWLKQAQGAPNMIDRFDALVALRDIEFKDKRKELILQFDREDFYGMRAEIVSQLVNDNNRKSQAVVSKALKDDAVQVRRAVIDNVKEIPKSMYAEYLNLLQDDSYVTISKALGKLAIDFPDDISSFLTITEGVEGHNHNVEIKRLSFMMDDVESLNRLIDLTGPSFEFRTRISAMDALSDKEFYNVAYMKNLIDAAVNFNGRLRRIAMGKLKPFLTDEVKKRLIIQTLKTAGTTNQQKQRALKYTQIIEES